MLVTATRNQAIDAVVRKLECVEGSLLVFWRKERLGEHARRYPLEERLNRHPYVSAWLERARELQELRDGGSVQRQAVARLLLVPGAQVCRVGGWVGG